MNRAILTTPALLMAILFWSCGSGDPDALPPGNAGQFRELVTDGVDTDYSPLQSAEQAVALADAIVVGNISRASEGRWWTSDQVRGGRSRPSIRYAILEVNVEKVLSGTVDPKPEEGPLSIALVISNHPSWEDVERALPKGQVLLILGDRSAWRASADVEGFPERVYSPSPDGIWFATDVGFEGLEVEKAELEERWGTQFASLDALTAALEEAAGK